MQKTALCAVFFAFFLLANEFSNNEFYRIKELSL